MPGKSNYFIGSDPTKWHTNVAHYGKSTYEKVYLGIDLVYYGNQQQLEYDFVVAPGAGCSDAGAPRWVYVDLSSVRTITEVWVLAGVGSPAGTANDATNWTTLTSASNASTIVYIKTPVSASARYVRINVTSHTGGSWISLEEFQTIC